VANQRTHVRYTPNCNAFISLGARFTRVGSIRNISLTGAAFEHFPYNQLIPPLNFKPGNSYHREQRAGFLRHSIQNPRET